jgi:PAS domain S-box-containing protein
MQNSQKPSADYLPPGTATANNLLVQTIAPNILDQVNDAIIIIDNEQKIIYLNKSAENLYGNQSQEILGQPLTASHKYRWLKPEDEQAAWDALATTGKWRGENIHIKNNGEEIYVESSVSVIKDEHGTSLGLLAVIRDITERKQAEAALRESEAREREKAQQLQATLTELQSTQSQLILSEKMASLGTLVAGVAHEINNPTGFIAGNIPVANEYMQNLLGLVELYQQYYSATVEQISNYIKDIELDFIIEDFPKIITSLTVGANRISEIVQSLRSFSRVDQAKPMRADIHEGIDNTLLLLRHRLKKQPHRSEIQVIKEYGKLPAIECFIGQLNQVFMNILSNAIDALEERAQGKREGGRDLLAGGGQGGQGGQGKGEMNLPVTHYPTIHIRTQKIDSAIVISIADNGVGIASEIQSRIFDLFFTTKPVGKGTGLGLPISYKIIVEGHHGEMRCHSQPGEGCEFVISLPILQRRRGSSFPS